MVEHRKPPRSSWRRFVADAFNEVRQADCLVCVLATGVVRILGFLDDHSQVASGSSRCAEATTVATWPTFGEASAPGASRWASSASTAPTSSGRLRGFEVRFEIEPRAIGVAPRRHGPTTS